ncbi:hypothetical protein RO3G_08538 [Lichtheimia corymbifera JMRC:FSU:9682]|uniref:Origin recognition complex subunit 6 n=1 Tax=Lichtheimia corymbifera JMRC:FSU:9682 TaxID=1263082 RepID=A0A068SDL4_9FUNG|nr:hypothetical protein RO3G_08538 [Lichtheimia corymbifera JMRC:FSU:9682]
MSATHNPLVHCLDRLNLGDDSSLRARAESVYGQCAKVPTKIFDMGPNCRPVVAIQLACESLSQHHGWDTKLAAQLAGCTKRQYENTVSTVRKSLNLQPNVSLDSLAVAFGSSTMLSKITRVWDDFSKEYLSTIPRAQRTQASRELNDVPAWKGALFFTCAKTLGQNIGKTKLQDMCACTATEINKYIKVINDICKEDLEKLKEKETSSQSTRVTRRTRRRAEDEEEHVQLSDTKRRKRSTKEASTSTTTTSSKSIDKISTKKPAANNTTTTATSNPRSGIVSMISHQHYKDTRRYKDYIAWSDALRQQLRTVTSNTAS